MELIAPVLLFAAVVLAAVLATRLLWFVIKIVVVLAIAWLIVSWVRPELLPESPLKTVRRPKIVTVLSTRQLISSQNR